MFIASCPECGDSLTFPAGVSLSSRCRCPLCTESFTLEDCLTELPPMVELLDGDGGLSPGYGGGAAVATAPRASAGAATIGAPRAQTGAKVAGRAPARKAKGLNPIVQMAQIVIGGAVGVTLAILIIWWGLGKDPFGVAPTVSQYAPFLVPAKFRPSDAVLPQPAGDDAAPAKNAGAANGDGSRNVPRNQGQPLDGPRFELGPAPRPNVRAGELPALGPIGEDDPSNLTPREQGSGGALGGGADDGPDAFAPLDGLPDPLAPSELELELDPVDPSALDPLASTPDAFAPLDATDPEMEEGADESPLGALPPREETPDLGSDFPTLPGIDPSDLGATPTEATPGDPFSLVMAAGEDELPDAQAAEEEAWVAYEAAAAESSDVRKRLAAAHYDRLAAIAQVAAGLPPSPESQAAAEKVSAALADRFQTPLSHVVANSLANQRLKNPDFGMAGVVVVGRVEDSREEGSLRIVTLTQEAGASPETKRLVLALRETVPAPEPGSLVAALGVKYAGTDETLPPSLAEEAAPIVLAGVVTPITPVESEDPTTPVPEEPAPAEPTTPADPAPTDAPETTPEEPEPSEPTSPAEEAPPAESPAEEPPATEPPAEDTPADDGPAEAGAASENG